MLDKENNKNTSPLYNLRKYLYMTLEDMSSLLGVSITTLSYIERGKIKTIHENILHKMEALGFRYIKLFIKQHEVFYNEINNNKINYTNKTITSDWSQIPSSAIYNYAQIPTNNN